MSISRAPSIFCQRGLRGRAQSFALALFGGIAVLLIVFVSPSFPGPVWTLEYVVFWLSFSVALGLGPGLIGLLTRRWPPISTLLLGMALGLASLEALMYSASAWGPFHTLWFKWLYFG